MHFYTLLSTSVLISSISAVFASEESAFSFQSDDHGQTTTQTYDDYFMPTAFFRSVPDVLTSKLFDHIVLNMLPSNLLENPTTDWPKIRQAEDMCWMIRGFFLEYLEELILNPDAESSVDFVNNSGCDVKRDWVSPYRELFGKNISISKALPSLSRMFNIIREFQASEGASSFTPNHNIAEFLQDKFQSLLFTQVHTSIVSDYDYLCYTLGRNAVLHRDDDSTSSLESYSIPEDI